MNPRKIFTPLAVFGCAVALALGVLALRGSKPLNATLPPSAISKTLEKSERAQLQPLKPAQELQFKKRLKSFRELRNTVLFSSEQREQLDAEFSNPENLNQALAFLHASPTPDSVTSPRVKEHLTTLDWIRASFAAHLKEDMNSNYRERAELLASSLTKPWAPPENEFNVGTRIRAGSQMEAFAILAEVAPDQALQLLSGLDVERDAALIKLYTYSEQNLLNVKERNP